MLLLRAYFFTSDFISYNAPTNIKYFWWFLNIWLVFKPFSVVRFAKDLNSQRSHRWRGCHRGVNNPRYCAALHEPASLSPTEAYLIMVDKTLFYFLIISLNFVYVPTSRYTCRYCLERKTIIRHIYEIRQGNRFRQRLTLAILEVIRPGPLIYVSGDNHRSVQSVITPPEL